MAAVFAVARYYSGQVLLLIFLYRRDVHINCEHQPAGRLAMRPSSAGCGRVAAFSHLDTEWGDGFRIRAPDVVISG